MTPTFISTTRRPSATRRSISAIRSYYVFSDEYDTAGAGNQVLTLASSVTVDVAGLRADHQQRLFRRRDRQPGRDRADRKRGLAHHRAQCFHQQRHDQRRRRRPPLLTSSRPPSPTAARSTSPTATRSPSSRRASPMRASSLITIEANSSVTIDPSNVCSNPGSITLASSSSLYLGGSITSGSGSAQSPTPGGRSIWKATSSNSGADA